MYNHQTFEVRNQMPRLPAGPPVVARRRMVDVFKGNLGNYDVQRPTSSRFELPSLLVKVSATSRLEELKRRRFTLGERAERVARSLAALTQEETIHLTAQEWQRIAEDPDIEDQY